ncbi:DUF6247 family protein [Streptomyces sp. NPDC013178]|uniref:DUF6247 family protein n=1 Tax=Streptomyces sp. NPDC013178 TaxID=3155118 RepID=UPI00340254D0
MSVPVARRPGYRGDEPRLEEAMSAQPDHAPAPPPAPAPTAAAQLRAQIRADRRAPSWLPAFEQDWSRALQDAQHSYSLAPLHDVVRTWQARLAAAPAVDAFVASGYDDSDGVALEDVLGPRR